MNFVFDLTEDLNVRKGVVVFVNHLSKMSHLAAILY